MVERSSLNWLFGCSDRDDEEGDDSHFYEFLRKVGNAFLYHELPSHVPISWEMKETLRTFGIQCGVPAFLRLFLGAVRKYEEDHGFRQPKLPPRELLAPFGISDDMVVQYVGLSGVVLVIAKTGPHSSIDSVVDVQRIRTTRCRGVVTFRRKDPDQSSVVSSARLSFGLSTHIAGCNLSTLPKRVTYRQDNALQMFSRGFSPVELGVFFRVLLCVAAQLLYCDESDICGADILKRFPMSPDIASLLHRASGCIFSINPIAGVVLLDDSGRGEDFILLVDLFS
ncbi:MAG: hypothetical protein IPJ67_02485 [Candidatus Moraniibacteriota bacterium]|nr:MAG: hypothetical protein IPJ67_02485 [Candidatus Moranbacteria bacterium]